MIIAKTLELSTSAKTIEKGKEVHSFDSLQQLVGGLKVEKKGGRTNGDY